MSKDFCFMSKDNKLKLAEEAAMKIIWAANFKYLNPAKLLGSSEYILDQKQIQEFKSLLGFVNMSGFEFTDSGVYLNKQQLQQLAIKINSTEFSSQQMASMVNLLENDSKKKLLENFSSKNFQEKQIQFKSSLIQRIFKAIATNDALSSSDYDSIINLASSYNGSCAKEIKAWAKNLAPDLNKNIFMLYGLSYSAVQAFKQHLAQQEDAKHLLISLLSNDLMQVSDDLVYKAVQDYDLCKEFIRGLSYSDKKIVWDVINSTKMDTRVFDAIANDMFAEFYHVAALSDLDSRQKTDFYHQLKQDQDNYKDIVLKMTGWDELWDITDINWDTLLSPSDMIRLKELPYTDASVEAKFDAVFNMYGSKPCTYKFKMPTFHEIKGVTELHNFHLSGVNFEAKGLPSELSTYILSFLTPVDKLVGSERIEYQAPKPTVKHEPHIQLSQYNAKVADVSGVKLDWVGKMKKLKNFFNKYSHEEHFWGGMGSLYLACVLTLLNLEAFLWVPVLLMASVTILSYKVRFDKDFSFKQIKFNVRHNMLILGFLSNVIVVLALMNLGVLTFLPAIMAFPLVFSQQSHFAKAALAVKSFAMFAPQEYNMTKDASDFAEKSMAVSFGLIANDRFAVDSMQSLLKIQRIVKDEDGVGAKAFQSKFNEEVDLSKLVSNLRSMSADEVNDLAQTVSRYDLELAAMVTGADHQAVLANT